MPLLALSGIKVVKRKTLSYRCPYCGALSFGEKALRTRTCSACRMPNPMIATRKGRLEANAYYDAFIKKLKASWLHHDIHEVEEKHMLRKLGNTL
jgi:hypothetical protein